jgi:GAF domain-containing protein
MDDTEGTTMPTRSERSSDAMRTLVELTRVAARGHDVVDALMLISRRAVVLLPIEACGILVRDSAGLLHAVGSSSSSAALLDLFQIQNHEGPCLDCLRSGSPVSVDASAASARWPRFAQLLVSEQLSAVHAFPMLSRGTAIGAFNLFAVQPLSPDEEVLAQALADVAALALLRSDVVDDAVVVARRLQHAVQVRATLGQAIGMIAERFALDPDGALERLETVAAAEGMALVELATVVVGRVDPLPAALMRPER